MKSPKFGRDFRNYVFDQIRIRLYGFTFDERVKYRLLQKKLAMKEASPADLKKAQAELSGLAKLRRERIEGQTKRVLNGPPSHGAFSRCFQAADRPLDVMGTVPSIKDASGANPVWGKVEEAGPPYILHFDGSYSSLPGVRSITSVKQGLVGWSSLAGDLIQRTVTGKGKDNSAWVSLGLEWSGTIPEKGMWALRRNGPEPLFMSGRHRVIASGWALSEYDAAVSVYGGMVVRVATASPDDFWSASYGPIRSSDATRSEDREKSFYEELKLPSEVIINAPGEAYVGVTIFLNIDLWADPDDENSLAFSEIGTFGIPANLMSDAEDLWQLFP